MLLFRPNFETLKLWTDAHTKRATLALRDLANIRALEHTLAQAAAEACA